MQIVSPLCLMMCVKEMMVGQVWVDGLIMNARHSACYLFFVPESWLQCMSFDFFFLFSHH